MSALIERPGFVLPGLEEARMFVHGNLRVIVSNDRYSLREANATAFGIRLWRHVSVSVLGWQRAPRAKAGMRSEAPLPDWYDLTHLVYHHPELGFDAGADVWQCLPPPDSYNNLAEALHLLQPR